MARALFKEKARNKIDVLKYAMREKWNVDGRPSLQYCKTFGRSVKTPAIKTQLTAHAKKLVKCLVELRTQWTTIGQLQMLQQRMDSQQNTDDAVELLTQGADLMRAMQRGSQAINVEQTIAELQKISDESQLNEKILGTPIKDGTAEVDAFDIEGLLNGSNVETDIQTMLQSQPGLFELLGQLDAEAAPSMLSLLSASPGGALPSPVLAAGAVPTSSVLATPVPVTSATASVHYIPRHAAEQQLARDTMV